MCYRIDHISSQLYHIITHTCDFCAEATQLAAQLKRSAERERINWGVSYVYSVTRLQPGPRGCWMIVLRRHCSCYGTGTRATLAARRLVWRHDRQRRPGRTLVFSQREAGVMADPEGFDPVADTVGCA